MPRLRVDELAARAGVSVDTIRYYQAKGLLPPPEREGRVSWYSDLHLELMGRIRTLKEQGFNLESIRRLLSGSVDVADHALIEALEAPPEGDLTMAELSSRAGVSPTLLEALEREGLLVPDRSSGEPRYPSSDADVLAAGLRLLSAGVPLDELLALARAHDDSMRKIARRAVEVFIRFVRDPIMAAAPDDRAAAEQLVGTFEAMLPATTELVAGHFRRVLLEEARARAVAE